MATNFTSLRNSRKSLLSKLTEEVKKTSGAQSKGADERFWKLSVDAKTGIGYAKIRFLPAPKGEEIPWARVFSHGFQGPSGTWFIENCPTTLPDHQCPVCKENNKLWNSGIESDKDIVRQRKRKLSFISNILVLEDSAHPENNNKVFLFKYGKKIHDKIMELLEPQFPDQKPANPFDFWEGCEFKLKAQKKDGYQNYDKSEFAGSTELFEGDDDAKEVFWEKEHSLTEFVNASQFKSYEELGERLQRALTGETGAPKTAADRIQREEMPVKAAPAPKTMAAAKPKSAAAVVEEDDDNEVKKFFSDLIDDDDM